jgi:flagellar hook assembly protein FlgD
VRRLRVDAAAAGPGSATWDGRDGAGRSVPAGIYFLELRAGGRSDRAKVVRLAR